MRTRWSHAMFVVLAMASSAMAQMTLDPAKPYNPTLEQPGAPNPETFGTASEAVIAISEFEFTPFESTTTFAWNAGRFITSLSGGLEAGFHLPAGASITRMEAQACNTNTTSQAILHLGFTSNSSGYETSLAGVGIGPNTGCMLYSVTLSPPHTVNNALNSYNLEWDNAPVGDGTIKIQAARVFYKLQVSPAPATPTFADVPTTHVFYQYIEALAAAGITSGCGGGNYCPDSPLTRGQAAVLLAKALGLHWAP
jgi:S-layer homology domain